jgi:DNA-binding NarL/FixJ family response regulator
MTKINQAYLFCLDEHRTFSEDVKKRFSDTSKYRVISTSSQHEFLKTIENERDHHFCKIAVITIYEAKDHRLVIENLTKAVKETDPSASLILVHPVDKGEEIKKAVRFNIDGFIPRNDNSIIRLHNSVKRLIGWHNLEISRKRRKLSLIILLIFAVISAILLILAYFKYPLYF